MSHDAEELTFEAALARLEVVVNQLETSDLDLDACLERFEEGIALYRRCLASLEVAEERIQVLTDALGPRPLPDAAELDEVWDRVEPGA